VARGPLKKGKRPHERPTRPEAIALSMAVRCDRGLSLIGDPPDPMFPAVSVHTLGSGCLVKQSVCSCTAPLWADRLTSQKDRLLQYLHLDQRPVDLTSPRSADDT
jgi:hypothetical protein